MLTLSMDVNDQAQITITPKVDANDLGGEMEQRRSDPINAILQQWKISYIKRDGAEVKVVGDFFYMHGGYQAFFWTPPDETVPRKFICPTHTVTYDHYTRVTSLTAELEEVPA